MSYVCLQSNISAACHRRAFESHDVDVFSMPYLMVSRPLQDNPVRRAAPAAVRAPCDSPLTLRSAGALNDVAPRFPRLQRLFDHTKQRLWRKGLSQDRCTTHARGRVDARDDHDWNADRLGVGLQFVVQGQPVESRKVQIEKDEVRTSRSEVVQRLESVATCSDSIPIRVLQGQTVQVAHAFIIFNREN